MQTLPLRLQFAVTRKALSFSLPLLPACNGTWHTVVDLLSTFVLAQVLSLYRQTQQRKSLNISLTESAPCQPRFLTLCWTWWLILRFCCQTAQCLLTGTR